LFVFAAKQTQLVVEVGVFGFEVEEATGRYDYTVSVTAI
jgi:hypothetical protein